MALKQDERALLQLLCERGQSYADLAGLLGIPEPQVRARARTALAELGGADPDAEVGLTDYLLGQADPIGRADAVRFLQHSPESLDLAETIATKLAVIAPGAQLPRLPEPRGRRKRAAAPSPAEVFDDRVATADPAPDGADTTGQQRVPGMAADQSRLIAAIGGIGVILLVVILAVVGVFGSDDGASTQAAATAQEQTITPVELKAEDGSGVAGRTEFGLTNDQLFVDLSVNGLDPNLGSKSVYVLWLMLSDGGGYPVSIVVPDQNGSVQERYLVPATVAVAVASNARVVQISESPANELRRQVDDAVNAGAPLVPFSGKSLARGRIPLAARGQTPAGDGGGGSGQSGSGTETTPGP